MEGGRENFQAAFGKGKGQGQGNNATKIISTAYLKCRLKLCKFRDVNFTGRWQTLAKTLLVFKIDKRDKREDCFKRFVLSSLASTKRRWPRENLVLVKAETSWRGRAGPERREAIPSRHEVGDDDVPRPKQGKCHIRRPVSTTPSRPSWLQGS